MADYRILSLDGGGIRGLLTTELLERLEINLGFIDQVDLFAGTSTGGVIALGLAAGYSPGEIGELYEIHAREAFADTVLDDFVDLGKLVGAEYDFWNLKKILKRRFGHMTLADLPRRVLITTFDLDDENPNAENRTWKPKFFHNFPGLDSDEHELIIDVALRTSAAPTFFPVYQGFIDGGVVANNPSTCALAQALHPETGGQALADVALFSVGTGRNNRFLDLKEEDWGLAQWARHLVDVMMDGRAGVSDYQVRQILGPKYLRLNPDLPFPIGMDDIKQIDKLKEIAGHVDLGAARNWLTEHFN